MITEAQAKKPIGCAIYLELEKHPAVTQVLLMPEGLSSQGHSVASSMWRRRISPIQPRKAWRQISNTQSYARARTVHPGSTLGMPTPDESARQVLSFAAPLVHGLVTSGWKVRKEPIIVEVSHEDLDDVRLSKTPYKVFGRVWKSRKALGFPKDFIEKPES